MPSRDPSPSSVPSDPTTPAPASPPADPPGPPDLSPLFQPTTTSPPSDLPPTIPPDPWSDPQTESLSPLELGDEPTSSSRSGRSRSAKLKGLRDAVKGAVATATGVAHQALTREGTPERDAGLYLADEDDLKAIGEPLAGLASRRLPSGAENPDVTDLIGLIVGIGAYLVKQMTRRAQIAESLTYVGQNDPPDVDHTAPQETP